MFKLKTLPKLHGYRLAVIYTQNLRRFSNPFRWVKPTWNNDYGQYVIYGLRAGRARRYFYIGRTKNAKRRLHQHIQDAYKIPKNLDYATSKQRDMANYIGNGQKIQMDILDTRYAAFESEASTVEDIWIAQMLSDKHPLTNSTDDDRQKLQWYTWENMLRGLLHEFFMIGEKDFEEFHEVNYQVIAFSVIVSIALIALLSHQILIYLGS